MDPKSQLFEQLARLSKALSASKRVEILDMLAQGPKTVERLANATRQTAANTSQHLQVLRAARLVDAEKNGLFVTYRLSSASVAPFLVHLRRLAEEHLAELRVAKEDLVSLSPDVESIDRDTLIRRLRSGDAVLLDVRPRDEYEAGHLPRAVSIPISELHDRFRELPKSCEIVAYCRGPYCMLSTEAARFLVRRGRRVRRLEDGVSEWKAAGLRVVTGGREQKRRKVS